MNRCVFMACLVLLLVIHLASARTENVIQVHDFLANVNFSEPKLFYVRNNLDGDIEFRESENASLELHLSADNEDEVDRVKIEYNLLDNGKVVDIQVYIVPETTTNWALTGGLVGAGVFVLIVVVIVLVIIRRRRRKNHHYPVIKIGEEHEMTDRGIVVAGKRAKFETLGREDNKESLDHDGQKNTSDNRPQTRSKLFEDKIATFERSKPRDTYKACNQGDNNSNQGDKTCHHVKEKGPVKGHQGSSDKGIKKKALSDQSLAAPSSSGKSSAPRPQSSNFLSARAAFLVLTLIAVALATSKRPRARIVISVPSKFVKNGSKVFFNEDFHGKLVLGKGWKGQAEYFEQFAVSEATATVPSLDPCAGSCQFACDVNAMTCICRRGYAMKSGSCLDIDECTTDRHNCHGKATCNNTIGGFRCTCTDGYFGDGITCQACSSKPCPENFYQSEECSRTRDRICTACTPRCEKTTYQAYGCGLTFDRKCIDISKPLTKSKADNDSDPLDVRRGSKLAVLKPEKDLVLLEDRLRLNSTSQTFFIDSNSPNKTRLHRNSSFYVEVEIEQTNFAPKYNDYDAGGSNENFEFIMDPGFPDIFSKHCRYPAPNHYSIKHVLEKDRQTKVLPATCQEHARDLCPDYAAPGEKYYYRSLNEACDKSETEVICPKPDQIDCRLDESPSKLFCTNYTNILTDLFGISEDEFADTPLQSFPTKRCAAAYQACRACRDGCKGCDQSSASCSCCYKDCLLMCTPFYTESDCVQIPKECAKGDTSQFTLAIDKPGRLDLRFNCFLEYDLPTSLYTLRYKVRHESGRFSSQWISKTLKLQHQDLEENTRSSIRRGTNRLDSLEVSHSTNMDVPALLYLRGQRASSGEEYKYSVSSLEGDNTTLQRVQGADSIMVQTKTPFALTTKTWSNSGNCKKLTDWSQTLRTPFLNLKAANVDNLGRQPGGAFSYGIRDVERPPTMTVSISEEESIFKYVLTNATIRNDETFRSSLSRQNTTWDARISGHLTSCPGFFSLRVVDEVDQVKVLEQDVVILCPETAFEVVVRVLRKSSQDNERLFSVFLSDAKQELKLQLALVDRGARKTKEPVKNMKDDRTSPWIILMPLFVTTGCVLLALIALMTYAQITHKDDETSKTDGPSGWKLVKDKNQTDGKKTGKSSKQAATKPKDPNRLKRRHLILVVFFVAARVVYSLVFTFSMAFAALTLLHASNMEIIEGYQEFVESKVDESNAIALKMDQHREGEVKRSLDSSEDIQRACDFYLGLQLQWLRFNMTCLIQENHLKMFNKLSKKIVRKVTQKIEQVKRKVKQRIQKFEADTKRKIQDMTESLQNYGRRVFKNGWFALPKVAYEIKRGIGRKRRELAATRDLLESRELDALTDEVTQGTTAVAILSRAKRSISDSKFIGFLDFVGAVDQDKLAETENSIKAKLRFLKDGLADFSDVLKTGKSPEHPLSTILMCPLRFMAKTAKEATKKGIKKLAEEAEEWAESQSGCVVDNVRDFFGNGSEYHTSNETESESFSERISYEEIEGADSVGSISNANKSSLIESARGSSYYNIEKGDIVEEMVDSQKEETLQREGRLKNVTSVYDEEVFVTTKNAVLGVLVVIDILLLIYRGTKTYKTALGLIEGFEETVEHSEDEFQTTPPTIQQKATKLLRRVLDIIAKKFSQLLTFCKSLHKRIMRTNFVPMCIIIAGSAALLYLAIALVFNVINVTVIEELGGYDMISSRLDSDFTFTNLAIEDQIDFINNNEMQFYKQTMNDSLSEYRNMAADFNRDQAIRMQQLSQRLCSLEENETNCVPETPALLDFDPQSCLIPRLEGNAFDGYDGAAYRERLKRESKRFVDAIRNIVLETIYFIIGVVLSVIIIAVLSHVVFLFLKSRGMVRVKKVHVYKALPDEILEKFHLKSPDDDDEQDGKEKDDKDNEPKKLNIPQIYLTDSKESLNTLKRETKA